MLNGVITNVTLTACNQNHRIFKKKATDSKNISIIAIADIFFSSYNKQYANGLSIYIVMRRVFFASMSCAKYVSKNPNLFPI